MRVIVLAGARAGTGGKKRTGHAAGTAEFEFRIPFDRRRGRDGQAGLRSPLAHRPVVDHDDFLQIVPAGDQGRRNADQRAHDCRERFDQPRSGASVHTPTVGTFRVRVPSTALHRAKTIFGLTVNPFIKANPGSASSSPCIDTTQEGMMMRLTSLAVLVGSLVATGFAVTALPAAAQSEGCGPAVYSNEKQSYVGLPCTPKADSSASPCGPATYSNTEQRYTGMPCTPPAKTEEGKAVPCGPAAYSNEHQRYVGVPCTH